MAYGSAQSHPSIHACVSEGCYENFGSGDSIAKVYGDHILISPHGLNWHFLAHEWSHDEMISRLSLSGWWHRPQCFNEGVTVAVSEAPEHAEDHWQFLVAANIPRPCREELHDYKSLRQCLGAIYCYGEASNTERRARGEPEIRSVYIAAGHEVRPWLTKAGTAGLLDLIEQLNHGAEFEAIYRNDATAVDPRAA
jgi:hypothetical protein